MSTYTWEELSKHNTAESAWIAINGKVYDITKFIPNHPGGQEYLKIAAGRDCTDLFLGYHNMSTKPHVLLPKFEIGTLSSYQFSKYTPDNGFYKKCSERVQTYFRENNLHPKDPTPGLVRLAAFMLVFVIAYYINFVAADLALSMRLLGAIFIGLTQSLCLLHQSHDASHSSIGYGPMWWRIIGRFVLEWLSGASCMSWFHQHVLGHHVYTNIMEMDPDMPMLKEGDLRFLVKRQTWRKLYQYQHIYMPILYGLLSLKFRIQDFTWTFMSEMNGPIPVNPLSRNEWINLFVTKTFFVFYRIVAPVAIFGVSIPVSLLSFLVAELVTGYMLAFNFQVSHISTEASFPCNTKVDKELENQWAISQVITSVDYGHGDFIQTLLSGALNYQTAHHLFPGVSQYHYPAIAPIIMEVCKEYNVPYTVLPGFKEAFTMHLRYLYQMGNQKL